MSRYIHTDYSKHGIMPSCIGEFCSVCRQPATHKIGEEIDSLLDIDFNVQHGESAEEYFTRVGREEFYDYHRHNYTAYLCCKHFVLIMGVIVANTCGFNQKQIEDWRNQSFE